MARMPPEPLTHAVATFRCGYRFVPRHKSLIFSSLYRLTFERRGFGVCCGQGRSDVLWSLMEPGFVLGRAADGRRSSSFQLRFRDAASSDRICKNDKRGASNLLWMLRAAIQATRADCQARFRSVSCPITRSNLPFHRCETAGRPKLGSSGSLVDDAQLVFTSPILSCLASERSWFGPAR